MLDKQISSGSYSEEEFVNVKVDYEAALKNVVQI